MVMTYTYEMIFRDVTTPLRRHFVAASALYIIRPYSYHDYWFHSLGSKFVLIVIAIQVAVLKLERWLCFPATNFKDEPQPTDSSLAGEDIAHRELCNIPHCS